jgi:ribulose-phosphate 3-epimerase
VHLEAGRHVHRALERIGESAQGSHTSPLRGLGVNPGTPMSSIEPYLDVVDVIYVLGINPGWRQSLLPSTLDRVRAAQELVDSSDREILVAVDGGITLDNFASVAALHPDIVVSGSAVFKGGEVEANLGKFTELGRRSLQ